MSTILLASPGEAGGWHRDRPLSRTIRRRHGLAVKKRAEGCGGGPGGWRARVKGQRPARSCAARYVSAAGAGGAGPGGAGVPSGPVSVSKT
jgi:hypothetical protein